MRAFIGQRGSDWWAVSPLPEATAWGATKDEAKRNLMRMWSRVVRDTYSPQQLAVVVDWISLENEVMM